MWLPDHLFRDHQDTDSSFGSTLGKTFSDFLCSIADEHQWEFAILSKKSRREISKKGGGFPIVRLALYLAREMRV